ncbi:MAG: kelch repeat-containing protein, partial [Chloroflexia bacterium]
TDVQGVSPNRTFIVEWRTVYFGTTTGANYELLLHEGPNGTFEVRYGAMNGTGTSATVGVQRGTGGSQVTQYECNTGGISDTQQLAFHPFGCGSDTPTFTNTPTPTNTRTFTPTLSPTVTPFCTPSGYSFTTSTGASITPGVTDIGNHTDDGTTAITLPFAFNFYGGPVTVANASSNGTLQFVSNNADYINVCLPDTAFNHTIFPHWDDQRTDTNANCPGGGTGCGIFTDVQGSVGSRVFIIEWRAVYFSSGAFLNYEVLLHEGAAGSFEVVYGTLPDGGLSATVGTQADTGSLVTQVECNTGGLTAGERIAFTYAVGNCPTNTPTNTPTVTPTSTPTNTPICAGDWTAQTVLPTNIMDNAVASQGGFVYSFGGYDGTAVVANAYKYDPGTSTWSAITALPAVRQASRAVSDGTYIYIVGGWDGAGAATTSVYRYDPVGNSYLTMASATQGASAPGLAYQVVGGLGKIYKIGGCADNNCTLTAVSEVYDITANTWSPIAAYPTTIAWGMATGITSGVNAGKVLAAGGTDTATTASSKTYVYDPGTNTWSDAAAPDLPDNTRWAAASDTVKTRWVLAGGVLANFTIVTNSAIAYDPATNSWSLMDPMLTPRYRMTGGTVGSAPGSAAFYAVGGSSGGFAPTNNNQRFLDICQPTYTPTPAAGNLVVHVTWQGIAQPNSRNTTETVTTTLRLTGGGPATEYTGYTTDANGFYTIAVGTLPNGTYSIRVKGPRNLANGTGVCTDTVTLTGAPVTAHESGLMRAGDAVSVGGTNFNVVNSTDFTTLKATFGKSFGQPGYDNRADFDNNDVVNSTDFTLLKGNFGQAGCGPAVDPGGSPSGGDPAAPAPGNGEKNK